MSENHSSAAGRISHDGKRGRPHSCADATPIIETSTAPHADPHRVAITAPLQIRAAGRRRQLMIPNRARAYNPAIRDSGRFNPVSCSPVEQPQPGASPGPLRVVEHVGPFAGVAERRRTRRRDGQVVADVPVRVVVERVGLREPCARPGRAPSARCRDRRRRTSTCHPRSRDRARRRRGCTHGSACRTRVPARPGRSPCGCSCPQAASWARTRDPS